MKVAPFRALTQFTVMSASFWDKRRNEGRPFQGIDTINFENFRFRNQAVEMKVAPFRALARAAVKASCEVIASRNEGRPFQGIIIRNQNRKRETVSLSFLWYWSKRYWANKNLYATSTLSIKIRKRPPHHT